MKGQEYKKENETKKDLTGRTYSVRSFFVAAITSSVATILGPYP